jgi:hypothetical protein
MYMLTLINRGLVCRHFFALMLSSPNAKFHIGLVSQRWYTDALIMEGNSTQLLSEPAISAISNDEFGTVEYNVQVDFSYLENIRGCYVFTEEIREEMTQKQQWGKGFGIMKKTLNLAIATGKILSLLNSDSIGIQILPFFIYNYFYIATGRIEELYEIHEKLAKEMEIEVAQAVQGNDITEFAHTISNPISIRTKGRKPKSINGVHKGKKRRFDENSKENDVNYEGHKESPHKKLRKALQDNSNMGMCKFVLFS